VIAVGGYDRTAIGEDMDLTIRLQAYFRRHGEPVRVAFDPHPLGWTQVPEDWGSLRAPRQRWRRGLLQSLWRHRAVIGRARFGTVGLGALPFMAVFEGLGPLLETAGYALTAAAAVLGLLNWEYFRILVVTSVMFGAAVTFVAVLLSDIATRRYMAGRDLMMLVGVVILESCGYRQLNSWWGCVGTVQAMSGKGGWGPMKRRAFKT
jgi:cellulose synthase/poly-beta-1,6-N-acetylglucosamine synthase-like glycosyltransferase